MKWIIRAIIKWAIRDELWQIKAISETIDSHPLSTMRYDIDCLRARVHFLERHLKVTNAWHHAEMSHPYDGFKWFKLEKAKESL